MTPGPDEHGWLTDWGRVWERRLRRPLDDHLVRDLAPVLGIPNVSLGRSGRVVCQRAIRVGDEIGFLALERDYFKTPVLRIDGPSSIRRALREFGLALERAIDALENAPRDVNAWQPIWIPFERLGRSALTEQLLSGNVSADDVLYWPWRLRRYRTKEALGGLGIVVPLGIDLNSAAGIFNAYPPDSISTKSGRWLVIPDAFGMPVALWQRPDDWESPVVFPARVDFRAQSAPEIVHGFENLAAWESEVVKGTPLTIVLTADGERVGSVTGSSDDFESSVSILSSRPRELLRRFANVGDLRIGLAPGWAPGLGRRWFVRDDANGKGLSIADTPREDGLPRFGKLAGLPAGIAFRIEEFTQSMELLQRELQEILVAAPVPPGEQQVGELTRILDVAVAPAALEVEAALASHPGLLDLVRSLRPTVEDIVSDLQSVVEALEDAALLLQLTAFRSSLIRAGLLPYDLDWLEKYAAWV